MEGPACWALLFFKTDIFLYDNYLAHFLLIKMPCDMFGLNVFCSIRSFDFFRQV